MGLLYCYHPIFDGFLADWIRQKSFEKFCANAQKFCHGTAKTHPSSHLWLLLWNPIWEFLIPDFPSIQTAIHGFTYWEAAGIRKATVAQTAEEADCFRLLRCDDLGSLADSIEGITTRWLDEHFDFGGSGRKDWPPKRRKRFTRDGFIWLSHMRSAYREAHHDGNGILIPAPHQKAKPPFLSPPPIEEL